MSEVIIDNGPNILGQPAPYEAYRDFADQYDGLMRTGISDPDYYESALRDGRTTYAVVGGLLLPTTASNEAVPMVEAEAARTCQNALLPLRLIPESEHGGLVGREQFWLDTDRVMQILEPPADKDQRLTLAQVPGLYADMATGNLVEEHGEPQFTVLSRYDVGTCEDMRAHAPTDVLTRGGHTLTADKAKILENLPALVELHEAVFRRQAARIGYYDGMYGTIIQDLLANENITGVAAFDRDSGKPFMFALFASGAEGAPLIPWINTTRLQELTRPEAVLAMPLVITAKFSGMSVFSETVSHAMHEIIYRTQAQAVDVQYNANLQSVLYTPRIIHASAIANGAVPQGHVMEVSVFTTS